MEESRISFAQLVETRKEEMKSMLPGLMAEVSDGVHTVVVYSPNPGEKYKFRADKKD